jgi:copper transport protein
MSLRRPLRLLAVAALAGAFVWTSAAPAGAHAVLESTNPAANGAVDRAPAQLALRYSEGVEISLGSVQVLNCSGGRVTIGAPHHGIKSSDVVASLPNLPPSLYVVRWRVISADSHPVQGAFYFRVGAGPNASSTPCAAGTASVKSSDTVGVLFGLTRFLVFTGLALLIGGGVFLVLIARGTSAAARTRVLMWIGWVLTAASTIGAVMLQGPYAEGSGIGDAFKWSVFRDILDTRFGHIAELRALFLVLALPFLLYERRANENRPLPEWWIAGAAIVGLALAATPGLAGHASTGDHTVLAVPIDAAHVAAMSIWFGGLVALLVSALGGGFSGGLRRALIRFSFIATTCVIVLVLSGLFAAWRQVGFTVKGYTSTDYGKLLLIKVAIVVGLVALAAISRTIVRRRRAAPLEAPDTVVAAIDERTVGGLRRSVGGEVLVGIAVLALTAMLVNAVPARSAVAPKLFSGSIKAGTGTNEMLINVTVDPARAGLNTIHVYTLKPDGTDLVIRNISGDLSLGAKGIEQFPANLRRAGGNHFLVDNLPITITGKWKLVIHVLRGGFSDTAAVFDVPIR